MSEQALETYEFVSMLYKNPYCQCDVYEKKHNQYRIFQVNDEEIIVSLIACIHDHNIDYSFHAGKFYLITPYVETIPLEEWKKQKHNIKESVNLCIEILFTFQKEELPIPLLCTCMDVYSIGIDNQNTAHVLINPSFSRLKYKHTSDTLYTDCAKILLNILTSSKELRKRHTKLSQAYFTLQQKVKKRSYQSMEEIMQDFMPLRHAFHKKRRQWTKLARITSTLLVVITILLVVVVLLFYYVDWVNSTYDGLRTIGGNKINHDEEITSESKK